MFMPQVISCGWSSFGGVCVFWYGNSSVDVIFITYMVADALIFLYLRVFMDNYWYASGCIDVSRARARTIACQMCGGWFIYVHIQYIWVAHLDYVWWMDTLILICSVDCFGDIMAIWYYYIFSGAIVVLRVSNHVVVFGIYVSFVLVHWIIIFVFTRYM